MDTAAIGIFDSGIGGLTVFKEIAQLLPFENLIYLGDTARVPYGGKSRETIERYSLENTSFLMEKRIKALIVACHTASSLAIDKLQSTFTVPILGVVIPGVEKALETTQNGRIGVIGTKGTIYSGIYAQALSQRRPDVQVFGQACPLLVPLVEEHFAKHPIAKSVLQEYLSPLKDKNIDTLILGCTHYPIFEEQIAEMMGTGVALINSAKTCALNLKEILAEKNLFNQTERAQHTFYVTDDPDKFQMLGQNLLSLALDKVVLV